MNSYLNENFHNQYENVDFYHKWSTNLSINTNEPRQISEISTSEPTPSSFNSFVYSSTSSTSSSPSTDKNQQKRSINHLSNNVDQVFNPYQANYCFYVPSVYGYPNQPFNDLNPSILIMSPYLNDYQQVFNFPSYPTFIPTDFRQNYPQSNEFSNSMNENISLPIKENSQNVINNTMMITNNDSNFQYINNLNLNQMNYQKKTEENRLSMNKTKNFDLMKNEQISKNSLSSLTNNFNENQSIVNKKGIEKTMNRLSLDQSNYNKHENNENYFGKSSNKNNFNNQNGYMLNQSNHKSSNNFQNIVNRFDRIFLDSLNPINFYYNGEIEGSRKSKFFVIKSNSKEDVLQSIKHGVWCSTRYGNNQFDKAFSEAQTQRNMSVYLFFSINLSGMFCGMAEMTSRVDYEAKSNLWSQDKWKGKFDLKWIFVKDVPNSKLKHIILPNNENKPVTRSRDAQDLPFEQGVEILKIFKTYKHSTSLIDNSCNLVELNNHSRIENHSFNKNNTPYGYKPRYDSQFRHSASSSKSRTAA